jgi:ABC-type glycerol-3-phosphate transport system substrate-binding protein
MYRSGMKRGVLGIAALLLLAGCASSPSAEEQTKLLENQTKLLEYEKCLDMNIEIWFEMASGWTASMYASIEKNLISGGNHWLDGQLEDCAKYRP